MGFKAQGLGIGARGLAPVPLPPHHLPLQICPMYNISCIAAVVVIRIIIQVTVLLVDFTSRSSRDAESLHS